MNELVLVIIVYLIGCMFNLAVIAYLNERKKGRYPQDIAIISWMSLILIICPIIGYVTDTIYNFFCMIFRKKVT